jgi:hypothetical protein
MEMDGGREVLLRSRGESEHEDGEKKLNGPETPAIIPPDRPFRSTYATRCSVSTSSQNFSSGSSLPVRAPIHPPFADRRYTSGHPNEPIVADPR